MEVDSASEVVDRLREASDTALLAGVVRRVALASATLRAGDCVAPRTVYEAVLEGRRAALAIDTACSARRLLSPSTAHPAATVTTPRQP